MKIVDWIKKKMYPTDASSDWYSRNGFYQISDIGAFDDFTGINVTEVTSLELAAVYACVKIISEDIASMPLFLYRRSLDGITVDKAVDHPLYSVLHGMANPFTSSGEWVEAMTAQAALTGNGFSRIEKIGKRIFLWPWKYSEVRIEKVDNIPFFHHREQDGTWKVYPHTEVFHLKGMTFDAEKGDDLMQRAKRILAASIAALEFSGRLWANGMHGGLYFIHPGTGPNALKANDVQNIKEGYRREIGLKHAGEPRVLREGMDVKRIDTDVEKLQLIEVRQQQIIEICSIFRMPPHKLADLSRATFSNIEHQAIEYVQHTMSPWRRRWKEAVHRCLLTEFERVQGQLYAEHNVESLLRGDFRAQAESFRVLLEKGVYSVNEVRRWLNLNPVDGGDAHLVQLNMRDLTEPVPDPVAAPFPQEQAV